MKQLTFFNKHLFWAYRNWVEENTGRAHIVIKEENVRDESLKKYVRNGTLILNVSSTAISDLNTEEFWVTFIARFGGKPHNVVIYYSDIEGFVSHLDGNLMPMNVVPLLLEDGPGLMVVQTVGDIPTAPTNNPRKEVNLEPKPSTSGKVVSLSDRRISKPNPPKDK